MACLKDDEFRLWLSESITEFGGFSLEAVERLVGTLHHALETLSITHRGAIAAAIEERDKLHQRQVKRLQAQLDKSELLSKGRQARADRIAEELKALRKQTKAKPSAQLDSAPESFERALERLFA